MVGTSGAGRSILAALCLVVVVPAAAGSGHSGQTRASAPTVPSPIPAQWTRRYQQIESRLSPSALEWVKRQAGLLRSEKLDLKSLRKAVRERFRPTEIGATSPSLVGITDGDIEAVVIFVLMNAASEMDNDLKSITDKVKAINEAKNELRDLHSKVDKEIGPTSSHKDRSSNLACDVPLCLSFSRESRAASAALARVGRRADYRLPSNPSKGDLGLVQRQIQADLDALTQESEITTMSSQMAYDRLSKLMSTLSNLLKKASGTAQGITQNIK